MSLPIKKFTIVALCLALALLVGIACSLQGAAAKPADNMFGSLNLSWRQGGDAIIWGSDGSNNYAVSGDAEVQVGSNHVARGDVYTEIVFPAPYDNAPLVYVTGIGSERVVVTNISSLGFFVEIYPDSPLAQDVVFNWMVIGE